MPGRTTCPGVMEVRQINSKLYGVRVSRHLIPKLKKVSGLQRANPKSDLFCFEMSPMEKSAEGALKRFKEIVAKAGLGLYFGVEDNPNL